MPVCLAGATASRGKASGGNPGAGFRASGGRREDARSLDIGLVNNMPGKALQFSERQFVTLLKSAAHGLTVRLWLYALPDVPRSDHGHRHISRFYFGMEDLWDRHLDGLIVTGMEPRAPNLRDEPYWPHLARLIEWAWQNTHSTVWSCLAAHAAVLHMDSIERRRLPEKRCGLFECHRVAEHPLTSGIPERFAIPHSRWNDLPEEELAACGYSLLTRGGDAGADSFVKQGSSQFVYFQGHPEYEGHSLLLEYLRDVGNYLAREADTYPPIPHGYFDRATADALKTIQERASRDRRPELLRDVRSALNATNLANSWQTPATCIYSNWLNYLCARKRPPALQPSDAAAEPAARWATPL